MPVINRDASTTPAPPPKIKCQNCGETEIKKGHCVGCGCRVISPKRKRIKKLYDENSFGQLMRDMLNFRTK